MGRRYSVKLKFQTVMEILTGDKTAAQVAKIHGVHPNTANAWKRRWKSLCYSPPSGDTDVAQSLCSGPAIPLASARRRSGRRIVATDRSQAARSLSNTTTMAPVTTIVVRRTHGKSKAAVFTGAVIPPTTGAGHSTESHKLERPGWKVPPRKSVQHDSVTSLQEPSGRQQAPPMAAPQRVHVVVPSPW